jgi:transmembrane sensor
MRISRSTRKQITAEAVDWFLRLQQTAADDRQGFSEWLLRSAAHVEEYLQVSSSWDLVNACTKVAPEIDALVSAAKAHHENDNVVSLPSRFSRTAQTASARPSRSFWLRKWWVAVAATFVLGALWVTHSNWQSPMSFQTAVGQQDSFRLQDGSVVFLNTNSKVSVALSRGERRIELVRGEARFEVAKDTNRPFTVATATATVRALGTVFNVRAERLSTQVVVLEGQVEVTVAAIGQSATGAQVTGSDASGAGQSPTLERVRLAAGERAAVTQDGIQTNTGPPIEAVAAWTKRRLVFREQPLEAVIHAGH